MAAVEEGKGGGKKGKGWELSAWKFIPTKSKVLFKIYSGLSLLFSSSPPPYLF